MPSDKNADKNDAANKKTIAHPSHLEERTLKTVRLFFHVLNNYIFFLVRGLTESITLFQVNIQLPRKRTKSNRTFFLL